MDKINELVIAEILKNIPKNINSVNYLSNILGISNKSVYRRLKGEIPFTITEVLKLSQDLKFSIDQILDQGNRNHVYFMLQADNTNSPEDAFYSMLKHFYQHTLTLNSAANVESLIALNHIPVLFSVYFEHLLKFTYYQWMHQNHTDSIKYHLCDVVISPQMESLQKKIASSAILNRNNVYILDDNVFLTTIKEIQYYYKRKLITDEEVYLIKQDLCKMLDWFEYFLNTGTFETGAKIDVFLSDLNMKVSSAYISYDNTRISYLFLYTINSISAIDSPSFNRIHKNWFDTIKKYSVLITQSNEVLRANFLEKQRMYIDNILDI